VLILPSTCYKKKKKKDVGGRGGGTKRKWGGIGAFPSGVLHRKKSLKKKKKRLLGKKGVEGRDDKKSGGKVEANWTMSTGWVSFGGKRTGGKKYPKKGKKNIKERGKWRKRKKIRGNRQMGERSTDTLFTYPGGRGFAGKNVLEEKRSQKKKNWENSEKGVDEQTKK